MSDVAIRVENLGKHYRLGENQDRYRTLRDAVNDLVNKPWRSLGSRIKHRSAAKNQPNEVWALRDITFEIKHGEVVGVIGSNGAGKSTLLKILSRITEPSTGFADVHGRVGSLLEVGTGFHQELTGRENIFLNGAILGMKRAEIARKFDEIVAFAEVAKFIDTPVKRYSSGMYLRLAFSVAAHLETEILLVDEVLAVGDIAFQRKCLGKMEETAAHGRTVLFVSHNLGAIKELCQTGLVLSGGQLEFRGDVIEGLARYSRCLIDNGDADTAVRRTGWRTILINERTNGVADTVASGEPFVVDASFEVADQFTSGGIYCIVNDSVGNIVIHQRMFLEELAPKQLLTGRYNLNLRLPALWLAPGIYTLYFKFIALKPDGIEERYFSERVAIDVTGRVGGYGRAQLAPPVRWTLERELTPDFEDATLSL